jgi:hypothetical protein
MRNSINKTILASLTAVTIGFAALGAISPASADVYSGRNGQAPAAFSATGSVVVGAPHAGAVARESFMAFYGAEKQSAGQCIVVAPSRGKPSTMSTSINEGC